MEGAREAVRVVFLMRPGSSDTPLRKHLDSLEEEDGSPRHIIKGPYDIETSEGYMSCPIGGAEVVVKGLLEARPSRGRCV